MPTWEQLYIGGHWRDASSSVVATASAAGLVGLGHDPTYSLSKYAVIGLVRSVAARLAPANLRHPERAVDEPHLDGWVS